MNRWSWIGALAMLVASHSAARAQRTCAGSHARVETMRLCRAFGPGGACAIYESVANFTTNHPGGVIELGTWTQSRAERWQVACLLPGGFVPAERGDGWFAWFVDEAGYPLHGNEPYDRAFCGSSGDDRIAVRAQYSATCGAGTIRPWIYGGRTLELYGLGGADEISGGAGEDRVDGGSGADDLRGEEGADVVIGGLGDDAINDDCVDGDVFLGGDDDDFIRMQMPVELTDDSPPICFVDGGDGDDTIRAAYLPYGASVICGAGDDTMIWKFSPPALLTPWSHCPADCEHYRSDPGLIEQPPALMCL